MINIKIRLTPNTKILVRICMVKKYLLRTAFEHENKNDIDVLVMRCIWVDNGYYVELIYMSDAFFTSGSCDILLCNQFFFIYCVGVLQNHSHFFVSKMSCWIPIVSNGNQQGPHSICGSPKYLQYYTKILNDAWFLLVSSIGIFSILDIVPTLQNCRPRREQWEHWWRIE